MVGCEVGTIDRIEVGSCVGLDDGIVEGTIDGDEVGKLVVGCEVGTVDGTVVGILDG